MDKAKILGTPRFIGTLSLTPYEKSYHLDRSKMFRNWELLDLKETDKVLIETISTVLYLLDVSNEDIKEYREKKNVKELLKVVEEDEDTIVYTFDLGMYKNDDEYGLKAKNSVIVFLEGATLIITYNKHFKLAKAVINNVQFIIPNFNKKLDLVYPFNTYTNFDMDIELQPRTKLNILLDKVLVDDKYLERKVKKYYQFLGLTVEEIRLVKRVSKGLKSNKPQFLTSLIVRPNKLVNINELRLDNVGFNILSISEME